MKIKTSELIGDPLDWAVGFAYWHPKATGAQAPTSSPSTNWAQGGPIIERERIGTVPMTDGWEAQYESNERIGFVSRGPTPLIAAMRCYVASKLGDEIDIPGELI